jgi:hypothetical protein
VAYAPRDIAGSIGERVCREMEQIDRRGDTLVVGRLCGGVRHVVDDDALERKKGDID